MGTAAAVLPRFGSQIFLQEWGEMCRSALDARRSWDLTCPDATCSPKPCPCHASQGAGSTPGLCTALGKDSLSCPSSGRGSLDGKWHFRHRHSVLKMGWCCVYCNPSEIPAPHTGTRGQAGFLENSCGKAGKEEENTG